MLVTLLDGHAGQTAATMQTHYLPMLVTLLGMVTLVKLAATKRI